MYLFSLRGKLPYFARTEHKNYSRSIDRFLQEMSSLQEFQKRLLFGGEIFFGLVFLKTYVLNKRLWQVFKDSKLKRWRSLKDVSHIVWALLYLGKVIIDEKMKEVSKFLIIRATHSNQASPIVSTLMQRKSNVSDGNVLSYSISTPN